MVPSPRVYFSTPDPPEPPPNVHVTLSETAAPPSLERRRIETTARDCILGSMSWVPTPLEITMTLDTRDDGTREEATYEGATMQLGACLTDGLKSVPLHEEGASEHIVIVVTASR